MESLEQCEGPTAEKRNGPQGTLSWREAIVYSVSAIAAFHLAYASPHLSPLIGIYLYSLYQLARANTTRQAFYFGFAIGLSIFAPQLSFLWTIFNFAAVPLWMVLAFWHGFFAGLNRWSYERFGPRVALVLGPVLWMGIEYFRSELYGLKFSWLSPGFAFYATIPFGSFNWLGSYGFSCLLMFLAALVSFSRGASSLVIKSIAVGLLTLWSHLPPAGLQAPTERSISIAGIQLEFPDSAQVPYFLDRVLARFPKSEILVLSEYSFDGPVPQKVKDWCKRNGKYLIAGGKEPLGNTNFYNTAFVVDPRGDICFRQVKSVPIQFFQDGLPAPEQRVWHSPWGAIGLCVCYDLSYTRVLDGLVRLGAQAIVAPTMDVEEWGKRQHHLHSRVGPIRAMEYGIPIFRLCSSGISQSIDARGKVHESASFPGQEEILSGDIRIGDSGTLPWDRWAAPAAGVITGCLLLYALAVSLHAKTWANSGRRGRAECQ